MLGTAAPSSTAFIHICLAGVAPPPCRAVTAAWPDTAPSVLAWRVAYCCSTGPREPAGPLPARAAGIAGPGGGWPRAAAVGSPVDGPVGAAGPVPIAGGEEGLVHTLHEGLGHGAPGNADNTHPAARPVDVLGATCCQHQEPHQKQLPGAPHGLCFQGGRPSPQGGLSHIQSRDHRGAKTSRVHERPCLGREASRPCWARSGSPGKAGPGWVGPALPPPRWVWCPFHSRAGLAPHLGLRMGC